MDYNELKERQQWSLTQKIDHTIGTIDKFCRECELRGITPYVAYSGGKDSSVLLDICRRFVRKDILAVFCNTGNEYPELVEFVRNTPNVEIIHPRKSIREMISTHGFPLISKEYARYIYQLRHTKSEKLRDIRLNGSKGSRQGQLAKCWRYLTDTEKIPWEISDACCDVLKHRPFAKYNKERNAAPMIATMASESHLRQQQYIRRGGCTLLKEGKFASYPISIWSERDVWEYIEKYQMRVCSLYREHGADRIGCMFCGFGAHKDNTRFRILRKTHPQIYNAIMRYENNGTTYRDALLAVGVDLDLVDEL